MIQSLRKTAKKLVLTLSGKVSHLKIGVETKHEWYGNTYGGFFVNPTKLNENSIVYSVGIGEDISFDQAIINKHKCQVFGFDPTPKSINWVKNQQLPNQFNFYEFGISDKTGNVDFYLPKNPAYVSGSISLQKNVNENEKVNVQMKTITDAAKQLGHAHIDVLKMDIEGAEYDVITSLLSSGISFGQLLIEFHDRFFTDGAAKTKNAIQVLKQNGFEIFAISDSFEEVSFINTNLQ